MPAPATYEYAAATIITAHTAVLDDIDAGLSNGEIRLYDESDTLLCTVDLDDPGGTVNGTTGQLTLSIPADGTAVADGTCSYGTITDSDGNVVVTLPASAGSSAVSGEIVINSLSILTGASVSVTSATIG